MEIWKLSACELVSAYRCGSLSPVEVMRATLDRADAVNPTLNALFEIRHEAAMVAAECSERRWRDGSPLGPLDGVPVTIKDSVAARGWPYWRGTKARIGMISDADSPPAARLMEAGAIIFAKTTMPDLGLLPSGVSSAHGVTRNPWSTAMNTGGSSSGAAAAVAAGIGPLAVGTDLAGSVRLPAAHCGLVGMKPTSGMVPHMPVSGTRVAGPLTRTVADAALMLSVLSRPDARTGEPAGMAPATIAPADLAGLRIGVLADMGFGQAVSEEVAGLFGKAVASFEAQGAEIIRIAPPFDHDPHADLDRLFAARAAAEREELPAGRRDEMLDTMRRYCEVGAEVTLDEQHRATERVERAKASFDRALSGYDAVLSPTMPVAGFAAEAPGFDPERPLHHLAFTAMLNQVGRPAVSMFCGFAGDGLPVGLQIIGSLRRDAEMIAIAAAYEASRGFEPGFPSL